MKKVTKHGRKRLKERNNDRGRNGIFSLAKIRGKMSADFEGEFHEYLESRMSRGSMVKVYKNNIYIYSKTSKILITTYPVPEKFLPVEQYLILNDKKIIKRNIGLYFKMDCIITLLDQSIINGIIQYKLYDEEGKTAGIVVSDNNFNEYEIMIDDIETVELDNEKYNRELVLDMGLAV